MSYELQSDLITTSLDFSRLHAFVEKLCVKLDADAALFRYLDFGDGSYPITVVCGPEVFSKEFFADYDQGWGLSDPHIQFGLDRRLPDKSIYNCVEHYDDGARQELPYFRDFLPKYDIKWLIGFLGQVDNQYGAGFAVVRKTGRKPFDENDKAYLAPIIEVLGDSIRLLLHSQRVKLIRKTMEWVIAHNPSFAACIDGQGRVLWQMEGGEGVSNSFKDIRLNEGKVKALNKQGTIALDEIKTIAKGNLGDEGEISLAWQDDEKLALRILPIFAEEEPYAEAGLRAALVYSETTNIEISSSKKAIGSMALLTKTELEIAKRVAKGMTAPKIADDMGIMSSTVRTHLRHSYRKLKINSKPELVAIYVRSLQEKAE